MLMLPPPEVYEKMTKIQKLSDAIEAARRNLKTNPGAEAALNLQKLQEQRKTLRGLLPPLRLV